MRAALLDLAGRILRHLDESETLPSVAFGGERKGSWHVQRIARYVEAHYSAPITLAGLAQLAGLSPYYLTRIFARYTGRGVMTYLGDVRHREATALLRNSDLAVAEVARGVGYDDPYYFSRVFRGREGCAPCTTGGASAARADPAALPQPGLTQGQRNPGIPQGRPFRAGPAGR